MHQACWQFAADLLFSRQASDANATWYRLDDSKVKILQQMYCNWRVSGCVYDSNDTGLALKNWYVIWVSLKLIFRVYAKITNRKKTVDKGCNSQCKWSTNHVVQNIWMMYFGIIVCLVISYVLYTGISWIKTITQIYQILTSHMYLVGRLFKVSPYMPTHRFGSLWLLNVIVTTTILWKSCQEVVLCIMNVCPLWLS